MWFIGYYNLYKYIYIYLYSIIYYVSKAKIHYECIMRSKENRKMNNEYTIIILLSPGHVFIKKNLSSKNPIVYDTSVLF